MQLTVIPPLQPALDLALAHSRSGHVVCYPTDTLYGLGADATDAAAVRRIFSLKGREEQKPFSVIFPDWEMGRRYVRLDDALVAKLGELTPGPYTFLLPIAEPLPVTAGPSLGCRIPDHEFCLAWAKELGRPVVSTSANPGGERPAASVEELDESIMRGADLIVDGGPCRYREGSTIIDVGHRKIVRAGAGLEKARKWLESL
ncbi:MAG: threonylcarbamoyl-AMP synthase [Candidatus Micrarchaeota archaeon]|nr:threonylcarbamoyl-AMP synthase [Candidatus Micrarchaeota archaeon]